MKIELSPKKIIKDAITVWNQSGPDVDIVMDVKNLTFKENSIDEIYVFHVLDHLFVDEVLPALSNWRKCLKTGERLFIIVDDFEFLARSFVGGDITVDDINNFFAHPTNFTKDNLLKSVTDAGFNDEKCFWWNISPSESFKKEEHELIMGCQKI